jgi:hypothetical protein
MARLAPLSSIIRKQVDILLVVTVDGRLAFRFLFRVTGLYFVASGTVRLAVTLNGHVREVTESEGISDKGITGPELLVETCL